MGQVRLLSQLQFNMITFIPFRPMKSVVSSSGETPALFTFSTYRYYRTLLEPTDFLF